MAERGLSVLEIIPAIDLIGGECVRLLRGDYSQKTVYSKDPVAIAQKWQDLGAQRLHVVDLDGAKAGVPKNLPVVLEIVKRTSLRVEMGGGLRDRDTIRSVMDAGVHYAILGTAALQNQLLLEGVASEYRERILVGIDARDGKVAVRGWLDVSEVTALDLIHLVNSLPIGGVIYTDIARDGAMVGPNVESLRTVADESRHPVTASGGVTTVADVRNIADLKHPKVVAAIIGKALYEQTIDLREAIRAAS